MTVEPGGGLVESAGGGDLDDNGLSVGRLAATVERLRREIREAQQAADGRGVLELARGVLVERLRCGPAEAARHLDTLAAQAGRTPLELAAEIINQAARDRVTDATQAFLTHAVRGGTAPSGAAGGGLAVATRLRAAESGAMAAPDTQAAAEALLT
ncbi:ANTAR domain-containing protein, partial [Spirillospora sp. NPDC049652]